MARLRRRAFLAGAGAALLAGCSTAVEPPAADSPAALPSESATDAARSTAEETPRGEVTRTSTGGVETRWETFIPGQYALSAPAFGEHGLYIGGDRQLRRLAVADGTVAWEAPLGALTHGFTQAVSDGIVYAAARDLVGGTLLASDDGGVVAALAASDGTEQWRRSVPVTADPVLADGAVLVPTTDQGTGVLRALEADTGDDRWRAPIGTGDAYAAASVDDDQAVVPSAGESGGRVAAVTLADGRERWSVQTAPVVAPAAVADGTAYIGTTEGTLLALDTGDSSVRWHRSFDAGHYTRPAVVGDTLYVAVGDRVHALARTSGTERWRAPVSNVSRTGLTVADGRVYIGGEQLITLAAASGERAWSQRLVGVAGTFGAPAVRDGVIYTGACVKRDGNDLYDHYVYALADPDR